MKTLIEDLKKVITSDIEDKDKYCEMLINGFLRERETEQLLIQRVVNCNHDFQRVERGGEFEGNQCHCGEWENLT